MGTCTQVVVGDGGTDPAGADLVLPVNAAVKASAASGGQAPNIFNSTTVNGIAVRQIIASLPSGFTYNDGATYVRLPPAGGAMQLSTSLTGVNLELRHLALALWLIVFIGVALAVLLGLAVGRTVLSPLNSLTGTVEELAETTDVSRRLDPGGPDELGRLRRAFNRLLVALDTSRESQRQLVLDASHELRTPLTSLRTNMEVARRLEELAPEERQVLISDVLTQMDELTTLVGDLAELARGEQPQLTAGPVRLDAIVLEAVEVATTHGRSRGVVFDAKVAPTWVSGSTARIGRAVDNLLDNALKWSPDGGVVEVACSRRHGHRARPRARGGRFRLRLHLRPLLPGPERPLQTRFRPGAGHRGPGGPGRGRQRERLPGRRWRGGLPVQPPRGAGPHGQPRRGVTTGHMAKNSLVD